MLFFSPSDVLGAGAGAGADPGIESLGGASRFSASEEARDEEDVPEDAPPRWRRATAASLRMAARRRLAPARVMVALAAELGAPPLPGSSPSGGASRSARTSAATAASGSDSDVSRNVATAPPAPSRAAKPSSSTSSSKGNASSADSAANAATSLRGPSGSSPGTAARAASPGTARGMPRCPAASPGTLSGDDPSAAHRGLVPYANGPPGPRMANVPENSWKEPRPERDDDGDDHDARRETLAPKFDGVRSTRQGVVAPGLPLGTVKPRKRQGGESALSALSAPDAARAASACAGDASEAASRPRRPPPPPRLPLPLPNAKGSVPIPGTATPGDDASREASAERNPPPEEPRPEEAPAGEADRNPSASAKPKIGAGPETGADAGARGESGGLDDEEGVAGPSPLAPLAGVPWKGECDPFTKDEGTPTSFPVPVPSTEDPIRASGSNLAISALSNPGRLESARRAPTFAAGPPAADVASAIPTRLGGGGVSTSSASGRKKNGANRSSFAEPGEVARNCVARAFQLPALRGRAFSFSASFSAAAEARDAYAYASAAAYASPPISSRYAPFAFLPTNGASPIRSAASASASRKNTDASRRPPPGAAAAANAYARYAYDVAFFSSLRGADRLLFGAAPSDDPSPSDEDAWDEDTDDTIPLEETPDMPSDVSDGVVLPEESPPPGSDRGERRARRNGGGFENASSLSPSSRLPPLTAKATRTVSAPSSVRRSAARRAYRCAGSVRSSACSVRKNTTSCLYAAETDGRLGPDWASGPTGPGPAETSASWRNTHRSTSTFFVSFVSPSASDSRKISSTMRRDGGSGAACAASLRHGRNASARDAHSSVSRLNCGDQTHPMFDRRSGRRARGVRGQSREALAVTKRARLGRSREKKRARSVFHVFSWNETRSRVRFGFLEFLENACPNGIGSRSTRGRTHRFFRSFPAAAVGG